MNSYLLINVTLTVAALTINYFMKIPHRVRFYIMLTAVIAWLIPFTWFSIELPRQTLALLPIELTQLNTPIQNNQPISQSSFSLTAVFYALILLGLTRFLLDLASTAKQVEKLKKQSRPYSNEGNIRITQGIQGAFVSGYFKPIIWFDENLVRTDTLSSVITHEKQHIRSHDQFWLFIITMVQRLFWFNPLSFLLCHQCKNGIELSCDEACKKLLGQPKYQAHLAQLVIKQHHTTHALMNNQIHQNKGFNIHRIKQLDKENSMTKYQTIKLSFIVGVAILMSTYSLITVAHNTKMPELADNQILLELKIQRNNQAPEEITLITNNGEMTHVTYDNHDFGFFSKVIEQEPTQIYTEISINKIENGLKTEIAHPGIVTTNTQWSAFKFGDGDTFFDIKIMATNNSAKDPLEEAVENYIEKNDPIPTVLAVPAVKALPTVPSPAPKTSAAPVSAPKPVAAPKPTSPPNPTKNSKTK